jgi:hypothetical protein
MTSLLRGPFRVVSAGFCLLVLSLACSNSGTEPIPDLVPLAGVWEAQVLKVPDPANPDEDMDLIPDGATYTLSILSTGQFTAVFDLLLVQGFETGTVSVFDDQITLTPVSPPGSVMAGTWMLQGDVLFVEAVRSLDIDGDGVSEVIPFELEFSARDL